MLVKKKQKTLAALLSAMCSVTSISASESQKTAVSKGQVNGKVNNQVSSKKNLNILSQKPGIVDLKDTLNKRAGILFLGSAGIAGLALNAKQGYDFYKARSKSGKLSNSASERENLEKQVEESEQRINNMEKDALNSTKKQIALEALVLSTSKNRTSRCTIKKGSLPFSDKNSDYFINLQNQKQEKTKTDEAENDKWQASLQKLSESLKNVIIKLSGDVKFKEKLNSSLSGLKPENGNGVIDLVKAILKAFEEAWCAADLRNTESDIDDYNKLDNHKARLEYFVDKYLALLLPIDKDDKDVDGLPKNASTRMVAILSHLFYKDDAPNKLTIEKFITNSFGNSIIISKLAKYFQAIRTEFSKFDGDRMLGLLELYSPGAAKKLTGAIDDNIPNGIFRETIKNILNNYLYIFFTGSNSILVSDKVIKNLLGSLVNDGCDNEFLPKNCFKILNNYDKCTLGNIKSNLGRLNLVFKENRNDSFPFLDGNSKLIDTADANLVKIADPSIKIVELAGDLFPEKKNEEIPAESKSILDDFMKEQLEEMKQQLEKLCKDKQLYKEFDVYEKFKKDNPGANFLTDDDKGLHLSFDDLDPSKWTKIDLDNLKLVHEWNYKLSCYKKVIRQALFVPLPPVIIGYQEGYEYDKDSNEWKQANKALEDIKSKFVDLKLKLVEPKTANIWWLDATKDLKYDKKNNGGA